MAVRSSMKTMPGMAAASRDGNAIRPRSESYSHRPRLRGRSFFPPVVAPGSPIELVRARSADTLRYRVPDGSGATDLQRHTAESAAHEATGVSRVVNTIALTYSGR